MGQSISNRRLQYHDSGSIYQPTIEDIISVKILFGRVSKPLPIEIIDQILDDASYWAHSSVALKWKKKVPGPDDIVQDKMIMRLLPFAVCGTDGDITLTKDQCEEVNWNDLEKYDIGSEDEGEENNHAEGRSLNWLHPRGEHPCRKIEFNLWSHDQGWSGEPQNRGSYRGSWTWFDVSVETLIPDALKSETVSWPAYLLFCDSDTLRLEESRFQFLRKDTDHPFLPPPTHLQRNIHAEHELHHHSIIWHYLDCIDGSSDAANNLDANGQGRASLNGNFIRNLRIGDCITLWMRARFPGWYSEIDEAKIEVYWAV